MKEDATQTEPKPMTPEEKLDGLFQGLWDRVRQSSELISELRSRNASLAETVRKLEEETGRLEKELTEEKKKGLVLERDVKELQDKAAANDSARLSNGELESIAAKARDLLGRIEEYL